MLSFPVLFGIVLLAWIYWLWSRRKYYALISKLPGPLGYPILGMGMELMRREDILDAIQKYSEHYDSTFLSWLGPYPFLVVNDPAIAQDILTSPHCVNKSVLYEAVNNGMGNGLFGLEEPKWSLHRKHLNPTFKHKVLLSFMTTFNEEIRDLLTTFQRMIDNNEPIDFVTSIQDLTLNIATRTFYSKQRPQWEKVLLKMLGNPIGTSCKVITENMTEMIFSPWLCNGLLRRLLGIYEPYNKSKMEIRQFIRKLIEEKCNADSNPQMGAKNVFIDQAIELVRRDLFTWQDVEDESNVIILGAFETTANAITYVLILLAMFPEYQEKVFEELVSIYPEGGDFEVSNEDIQNMVYLDMVLNESMRIMAPVPLIARENTQEVKLSNGVVLPAGIQIAVNIFYLHRRKDIWGPEAHIFNPDNFLPSNMEGKHPYAFIPFTKGIRTCIGWRYGLILAKMALAKLLRNYRWSTDFQYKDLQFVEAIVIKLKEVPVLRIHKREL